MRIFTPARELPFAGHPTIGTAWVLAAHGLLPENASAFNLEEGIGPVPVTLEGDPARPSFIWMRHREPEWGPELTNRAEIAAALGLAEADLVPGAPIQSGSTGSRFLFVPLRDRATVDRALLDVPKIIKALGDQPLVGIFVFAPDPDPAAGRVSLAHVRAAHLGHSRGSRPPARPVARSAPISCGTGSSRRAARSRS